MGYDWKYGNVTTERGTIAPDEPVFIIRGRDVSAPDAIDAYAEVAAANGADETLCATAHERADSIRDWQLQRPDVVKVPSIDPGQIVKGENLHDPGGSRDIDGQWHDA